MISYDAVVLAGGAAVRLGGIDKPALVVGGTKILDRILTAVQSADRRIVVGPVAAGSTADVLTCEDPPGGGPVAAIAAGLAYVDAANVAILAGDLPFVVSSTMDSLRAAMDPGADVVVLVDDTGRDQPLIALWRTVTLRARVAEIGDPNGQSVRRLFDTVPIARVRGATGPGQPPPWLDCDTEHDLRRARQWV